MKMENLTMRYLLFSYTHSLQVLRQYERLTAMKLNSYGSG